MLLALTTASRASELTHLDIRYMILPCFIDSHPKRIFKGFGGHKNLCVCKALEDLQISGINVYISQAHSTRSAFTSKAF